MVAIEHRVQLFGAGKILREVIAAAASLAKHFGVSSDIWSCPSLLPLRRDGFDVELGNRLHPDEDRRQPYVTELLRGTPGRSSLPPIMCARFPIRFVRSYPQGGTSRCSARTVSGALIRARFCAINFEVDSRWIAHAVIDALTQDGQIDVAEVSRAVALYKFDANEPEPWSC